MATIISKRFPEDDARKLKAICGIMRTNVTTVINAAMLDWVRSNEHVLTGIATGTSRANRERRKG